MFWTLVPCHRRCEPADEVEVSSTDQLFVDLGPPLHPASTSPVAGHHVYLSPTAADNSSSLDCIEAVATSLEDFSLANNNNNIIINNSNIIINNKNRV